MRPQLQLQLCVTGGRWIRPSCSTRPRGQRSMTTWAARTQRTHTNSPAGGGRQGQHRVSPSSIDKVRSAGCGAVLTHLSPPPPPPATPPPLPGYGPHPERASKVACTAEKVSSQHWHGRSQPAATVGPGTLTLQLVYLA